VAYMGFNEQLQKIMIIFRGTVDIKNWVEDLSYYQTPYASCKNCQIHEGFYLSYLSISDNVYSQIDKFIAKNPKVEVVVLGSSLGAALATVAAL
jgi:hypothetical protein